MKNSRFLASLWLYLENSTR